MEPNLSRKLLSAYRLPGAAIDGFRMTWQNVESAKKYGGRCITYKEVTNVDSTNGVVTGVTIKDRFTGEVEKIACDFVINAAGSWLEKLLTWLVLKLMLNRIKVH